MKQKIDKNKFCYLTPNYPKTAFILNLFLLSDGEIFGILPMSNIYTSFDNASKDVKKLIKDSENKKVQIPFGSMIIPITFQSLYELKPEYWENPSMQFKSWDRMTLFIRASKNPLIYHLLVTPRNIDEKDSETIFDATLPLQNPNDKKLIENFMYTSDKPVDKRAKYAAIYSMGKNLKFNWKTKQVTEVGGDKTAGDN